MNGNDDFTFDMYEERPTEEQLEKLLQGKMEPRQTSGGGEPYQRR